MRLAEKMMSGDCSDIYVFMFMCAKSMCSRLVLDFAVRCLRCVDADLPSP